ncbi:MAG TPA: hypothetical protein VJN96_25850 [Vicinamibacterales bacterium]|nr:hypothetical protein [Vicinamibacterales bacterium]
MAFDVGTTRKNTSPRADYCPARAAAREASGPLHDRLPGHISCTYDHGGNAHEHAEPRQESFMKLKGTLLAAMMAVPMIVWAQQTPPTPAGATPKSMFERMQANVAKIADPAEKERWQANTALWNTKIGKAGSLDAADFAKMQPSFDTMQANVAKITDPAEKERWQANCALWKVMLAHGDKLAKADLDTMKASFDVMKTNVAKIANASEKARWQTNRDLWQTVVGHN